MPDLYTVIHRRRIPLRVEPDPINKGFEIATMAIDVPLDQVRYYLGAEGMIDFLDQPGSRPLCPCATAVAEDGGLCQDCLDHERAILEETA